MPCREGGTAVLELLADEGIPAQVLRVGYPDAFIEQGEQPELRTLLGLDEVTGKGASRIPFSSVDIGRAAEYAAQNADFTPAPTSRRP